MDVFEALRMRSSVRDYKPDPISVEKRRLLEEAALSAPTSLNLQQQKFYFITKQALLRQMTRAVVEVSRERGEADYLERLAQREGKVFFGAPLVVVIAVNAANNYVDVDAGIAVQNLALAAKALGLDSVVMAAPDRIFTGEHAAEFAALLGFPNGYRFAIAIAIGTRRVDFAPHIPLPENIVEV